MEVDEIDVWGGDEEQPLYDEKLVFGSDEEEWDVPYEGGDEKPNKNCNSWHLGLIIAIVVAFIFIYVRENFALPLPTRVSNLPYTSGADIRMQSIDSSTNRGGVDY